jgi:hypothetical protein
LGPGIFIVLFHLPGLLNCQDLFYTNQTLKFINKTMITSSKSTLIRAAGLTTVMRRSLLGLGLAIIATSLHAQSILVNGQVSGVSAGAGSFDYTLTVGEGSGTTTPIACLGSGTVLSIA